MLLESLSAILTRSRTFTSSSVGSLSCMHPTSHSHNRQRPRRGLGQGTRTSDQSHREDTSADKSASCRRRRCFYRARRSRRSTRRRHWQRSRYCNSRSHRQICKLTAAPNSAFREGNTGSQANRGKPVDDNIREDRHPRRGGAGRGGQRGGRGGTFREPRDDRHSRGVPK